MIVPIATLRPVVAEQELADLSSRAPCDGKLRPDSNVKSWLFTILRNIWLNQLRQRKIAPDMVGLDADEQVANRAVDSSRDPHAAYVSDLEGEQVRHAIEQLPLEFREVILLREYEELSYENIAAMLECPAGTVMSRLARARSKLRDLLVATAKHRERTATMVRQRLWTTKRDLGRKGGSESAVLLFAEKLGNISILCVFCSRCRFNTPNTPSNKDTA